jgi:hypothetical protein
MCCKRPAKVDNGGSDSRSNVHGPFPALEEMSLKIEFWWIGIAKRDILDSQQFNTEAKGPK